MIKSLFHSLPAELRNWVYALLMPKPQQITVNLRLRRYEYLKESGRTDIFALARTCKDVYLESMSRYYASNHYTVILAPFYPGCDSLVSRFPAIRNRGLVELQTWLEDIGEYLSLRICDLQITIEERLGFLKDRWATVEELRPVTTRLAEGMKNARSRLNDKVAMSVNLELPIDDPDSRWSTVNFDLRHVAIARTEVDDFFDRRKRWLRGRYLGVDDTVSRRERVARELQKFHEEHEVTTERVKWFLGMLSV